MRIEPVPAITQRLSKITRLIWVGVFLTCFFPEAIPADEGTHKNVLILHSYHPGLSWTDSIMSGMREVFAGSSKKIRLHVEYLDTQRYPDNDYLFHVLDAIFHYKLKHRHFDLVLLSDNSALSFALSHRNDLFLGTPIVFCGINNFQPSMVAGHADITGIAEYPSFRETIEVALQLHPQTEEMVVIGGSRNLASIENRKMLSKLLAGYQVPVRVTFWDDIPIEDLAVRLRRLPKNRLVLISGSVASRSGEVLSYSEGIQAIRESCARPMYSFWDFFLGEGIVGGKLVSGREQGRLAAELALRVLQGEDPDSIEVLAESNRFMFDDRELRRFSLPRKRLPEGSMVINRPPPFTLSKGQLGAFLGCMTALAFGLLINVIWRRRAQLALREEKERVALLLDSTAEAIYGLDPDGTCTFCNPAALRLLGYRHEDDLLGKNIHELIHHTRPDGSHCPATECGVSQAIHQNQGLHADDEIFWRADGTSFPVEYWSHPIRKGKEIIGAVVTFLDISERKRAESETEKALAELNAFVYTVSHDLRSPLAAIIGFSEFLQNHPEAHRDGNARIALAEIQKQGERMSAMMEDLLDLAKVGKLPRPAEPIDAAEVVREIVRSLDNQLAAAGLAVRLAGLPPVKIPRTFLSQIFSNLIGNALRYAGAQSGSIEVGGVREKEKVRFFVRDHGPGIPAQERERIFDVFFRGSSGENVSGTGIGLATVQKIAQFYDGRAWVEETPGGGATFWVEMADPV